MRDGSWNAWRRHDGIPVLADGEVHVWRARLDGDVSRACAAWEGLSADERARADRFVFDRDRRRFVVGRAVMRTLLGRYLDLAPGALRFAYGESGKPSVADGNGDLAFNLSHSGEVALLAVTRSRDVGVDVEQIRRDVDTRLVASGAFAAPENEALERLPARLRQRAFFACWTRKEAYVKALGQGLGYPTDRFVVSIDPSQPARLLWVDGDAGAPGRWSLDELTPAPGYVGALAVADREPVIRTWSWD